MIPGRPREDEFTERLAMRRRRGLSHVGALAILVSVLGCTTAATPSDNPESVPLKQVADVPLPGPAVRFDYQSLDASHGRLYIAHMNADQLVFSDQDQSRTVVVMSFHKPTIPGRPRSSQWQTPWLIGRH